ncbi:MAG: medium chain dehydrogenase/reductase family protein [Actinobacteria bacterium]|nr:medium chain dehydrogenase/reductase family protein [Actinomycetota bacterium]MCI0542911.1 medium chain dehydrogenase/reductase family protein [Actinomycetota bacterium]MCI0679164.1 medium chain dehydrogenase/reductase family protein [Actinomycetota bacterium]
MQTTARAMMLVEPRHFTDTAIEALGSEDGGWLAVEATGISGNDVQIWKGEARDVVYPLVPGHEVVGRVAVQGPNVPYPVGTRVVVEPRIRCGVCHRCRQNLATCVSRKPTNSYGMIPSIEPPGLWGGLAELLYLDPNAHLHPVTDDVPAEVATFVHPLASGHTWAVELPALQKGEGVLILGPGPRGLACLIAAKVAGAGWVGITGLSHDGDRLDLARRLGADLAIDAEHTDVAGEIAGALGRRPDVVIDVTSDDPEAVFTALDLVRSGGRVILASTKGNRAFHFLSDVIVAKQLTMKGAMGASSVGYQWATSQLETDPRIDDLVSHQFPLSEASHALQAAAGLLGRDELISVAVTF